MDALKAMRRMQAHPRLYGRNNGLLRLRGWDRWRKCEIHVDGHIASSREQIPMRQKVNISGRILEVTSARPRQDGTCSIEAPVSRRLFVVDSGSPGTPLLILCSLAIAALMKGKDNQRGVFMEF